MTAQCLPNDISLRRDKRVLFLTKDLVLLKKQLYEGLNLKMADLSVGDLLDDINTDMMTPAWVCFDHRPEDIAANAYAGLVHQGERVFKPRALMDGNFEVIVSGYRKGTGSSRETAAQCERYSGVRMVIAASFAPIHERNNINLGQLMAGHGVLVRLQAGESVQLSDFLDDYDLVTQEILRLGGLFPFLKMIQSDDIDLPVESTCPRPMTMVEKIIARKVTRGNDKPVYVMPGQSLLAVADGGYSHEFTTAQVHDMLLREFGNDYKVQNPEKLAVFEDHLLYADGVKRFEQFTEKIQTLRSLQREFQRHTGVRDYSASEGVSPGICHQVAREHFVDPGDFILATDSHTCMGGGNNALAYGVGTTEYAAAIASGYALVKVPESIRFELRGELRPECTAKDVMLEILATYAREEATLDRAMEFGGPGLNSLSMDERATLCNMATECTAKTGIAEGDERTVAWLAQRRLDLTEDAIERAIVCPDEGAHYAGGVHQVDLAAIRPMVAHPGDPDRGIPSDPTNGVSVEELGQVAIDIAYGGSCTAGKLDDFELYARVVQEAVDAGLRVADGVDFFVQFGSAAVAEYAHEQGWTKLFERAGVRVINPGCGACIGCGPGVSDTAEQVTVSAINRNFQGRSGPGKLYLASPLTVAASAFVGHIVVYEAGMFAC